MQHKRHKRKVRVMVLLDRMVGTSRSVKWQSAALTVPRQKFATQSHIFLVGLGKTFDLVLQKEGAQVRLKQRGFTNEGT